MSEKKQAYFSHNMQYIKDLSFENPAFPLSLREIDPKINFNVEISINQLEETEYEVVLDIVSKAMNEENILFLVELKYGGLFTIETEDEELKEFMLKVKGPEILFPFARRVIADVTRDGGLPPLLLTPMDFESHYEEMKENRISQYSN